MTLYIKLALVAALLGILAFTHHRIYDAGFTAGVAKEHATVVKLEKVAADKENARVTETAKAILAAQQENEKLRLDNEAKARKVTDDHQKEIKAITAKLNSAYQLRLSRSVCNNDSPTTSSTGSSGSYGDVTGTITLPESIAGDLRRLVAEADEVTAQARALQEFAKSTGSYGLTNNP